MPVDDFVKVLGDPKSDFKIETMKASDMQVIDIDADRGDRRLHDRSRKASFMGDAASGEDLRHHHLGQPRRNVAGSVPPGIDGSGRREIGCRQRAPPPPEERALWRPSNRYNPAR